MLRRNDPTPNELARDGPLSPLGLPDIEVKFPISTDLVLDPSRCQKPVETDLLIRKRRLVTVDLSLNWVDVLPPSKSADESCTQFESLCAGAMPRDAPVTEPFCW